MGSHFVGQFKSKKIVFYRKRNLTIEEGLTSRNKPSQFEDSQNCN